VYVGLALLTAAFMAGLAGGALAAARSRQPLRTLRRALGGILFAALIVWPGLQLLDSAPYAAAIVLTAALGGLLGIAFAAAVALWPTEQDTPANAARCLYAADVLGAAPAALLIAAVIVPVDGYLLTAAIAAASALFALIASHPLARSTRRAPESHP
jgi:predicted membrane-bound spermidine synthase